MHLEGDEDYYRLRADNGKLLGDVYKEVDGYYVWWPLQSMSGCWTAGSLKEIANVLDELNADWDAYVRENLK